MATKGSTKSKKVKKKAKRQQSFDQRVTAEGRRTAQLGIGDAAFDTHYWRPYRKRIVQYMEEAASAVNRHMLSWFQTISLGNECPGPFYTCLQVARPTDSWLIPFINNYLRREIPEGQYGWDTLYRGKILACKLLERWKDQAEPAIPGLRHCAEANNPSALRDLARKVIRSIVVEEQTVSGNQGINQKQKSQKEKGKEAGTAGIRPTRGRSSS